MELTLDSAARVLLVIMAVIFIIAHRRRKSLFTVKTPPSSSVMPWLMGISPATFAIARSRWLVQVFWAVCLWHTSFFDRKGLNDRL